VQIDWSKAAAQIAPGSPSTAWLLFKLTSKIDQVDRFSGDPAGSCGGIRRSWGASSNAAKIYGSAIHAILTAVIEALELRLFQER
jgi:hypothetical protein